MAGNADLVNMLCSYKAWANELIFKAVSQLPESEVTKERATNFKTILSTLNHVYVVDNIFKAHLTNTSHGYTARNTETSPPLSELWQNVKTMDLWYLDHAKTNSEDQLSEMIEFEFVGGGQGAMTRLEVLLHVVNHATYHRGFVSDMLYQIPVRPPVNDLPVFLRDRWTGGRH